jgi:hypothetical protein
MGLILPDFGAEQEAPSGFYLFFFFSHDAPVDNIMSCMFSNGHFAGCVTKRRGG